MVGRIDGAVSILLAAVMSSSTTAAGQPSEYSGGVTYAREARTWTCYAPHQLTGEIVAVKGWRVDWIGPMSAVIYDGAGWPKIVFNRSLLDLYPPILELFAYYHECAHLTVPTTDEALANCEGLIAMRQAGDVTPVQEAVLRDIHYRRLPELGPEYGGSGRALWDATIACADKPLAAQH